MDGFLQFASALREQMNATLSRSDALKPLNWLIATLATTTLATLAFKAPPWTTIVFVTFLALSVALYFFAYIFFLIKDRDALRSEKYSLQKMAIEHGLYGDNRTGLIEIGTSNTSQTPTIASAPTAGHQP